MSVEDAADRATFLAADEFGVAVTYTPAGGAAVAVTGIFGAAYAVALGGPGVASAAPAFVCAAADLPAGAAVDDTLIAAGVTYRVAAIEPDGTGMTRLRLEETG